VKLSRHGARNMKIGELARQTGCKVETIRFYESVGLLPAPSRGSSGHRLYTDADQRRLTFIRRARDLGFSMDDVRALLDLSDNAERSSVDGCGLARAHLDRVRAKITALRAMEDVLQRISDDCTDTTRCRLLELFSHSEPSTC
jgi:MerR family transcriptional regulator, mercuric resistance operon regulatory protein